MECPDIKSTVNTNCQDLKQPSQKLTLSISEISELIKDGRLFFKGVKVVSISHLKELSDPK